MIIPLYPGTKKHPVDQPCLPGNVWCGQATAQAANSGLDGVSVNGAKLPFGCPPWQSWLHSQCLKDRSEVMKAEMSPAGFRQTGPRFKPLHLPWSPMESSPSAAAGEMCCFLSGRAQATPWLCPKNLSGTSKLPEMEKNIWVSYSRVFSPQ